MEITAGSSYTEGRLQHLFWIWTSPFSNGDGKTSSFNHYGNQMCQSNIVEDNVLQVVEISSRNGCRSWRDRSDKPVGDQLRESETYHTDLIFSWTTISIVPCSLISYHLINRSSVLTTMLCAPQLRHASHPRSSRKPANHNIDLILRRALAVPNPLSICMHYATLPLLCSIMHISSSLQYVTPRLHAYIANTHTDHSQTMPLSLIGGSEIVILHEM